MTSEARATK